MLSGALLGMSMHGKFTSFLKMLKCSQLTAVGFSSLLLFGVIWKEFSCGYFKCILVKQHRN